jgi:lipopolysaccharide export system protein LptA
MNVRIRLAALAFVALAALAGPLAAEQGDRDKPINYSADTGDVNYQTKVGALRGNVVITQGTMTIHADRIDFKQNPDNSVSAVAHGNPVTFRQKQDGKDEYFEGYAQRAEYDGTKTLLELYDNALLKRGQDEIRSNYISYNSTTEQFKAEGRLASKAAPGEGPGARVRGVLQPKSEVIPKAPGEKAKEAPKDTTPTPALKPAGELQAPAK